MVLSSVCCRPICLVTLADGQVVLLNPSTKECGAMRASISLTYTFSLWAPQRKTVGRLQVNRTCCHPFRNKALRFPATASQATMYRWGISRAFYAELWLVVHNSLHFHTSVTSHVDLVSNHVELSSICWTLNSSYLEWNVLTLGTLGVWFHLMHLVGGMCV